jgi:cytochrome b pre-mRNA-processing protein 3
MKRLFGRAPEKIAAHTAYIAIVAQAREPAFYAVHGVPDTLDGRFELIALHAFLVLHRLRSEASAQRFGQALFDVLFADMDRALREMGTGDLSVGKQVKRMATGFYGRVTAYQAGLAGESDLSDALRRNLFGTTEAPAVEHLDFMAAYLHRQSHRLAEEPADAIADGRVCFAPVQLDSDPHRSEL